MHKYYYSGTQLLAEEWSNHLIIFLYDANGAPLGMKYRTTSYESSTFDTYRYELDLQGDVVGIYSEDGTKYATYRYDAWGNQIVTYYNGGATVWVPVQTGTKGAHPSGHWDVQSPRGGYINVFPGGGRVSGGESPYPHLPLLNK